MGSIGWGTIWTKWPKTAQKKGVRIPQSPPLGQTLIAYYCFIFSPIYLLQNPENV